MQQEQKWWAKKDQLKMADTDAEHTPQLDVFKQVHVPKQVKDQVVENVTASSPWKPSEADAAGPQLNAARKETKSWAQAEAEKRCNGDDRLFDRIVKQAQQIN